MTQLLPRRLLERLSPSADAGFTLVEMMVAITLVTGAILALLGMITSSLETHRGQRDEAGAERVASTQIETARNLPFASLSGLTSIPVAAVPIPGPHGLVYNTTTTVAKCSVADRGSACTPATASRPTDLHVLVHVTWNEAGRTKALDVTTGVADGSSNLLAGAGNSTIGALVGGAASATAGVSTSVTSLTTSPSSVPVDGQGHPLTAVTVTATVVGLPAGASFPVTWTDDTGSHQATMTNASATTWAATIKTTDLTRVTGAGQPGTTVGFSATVPGSRAIPSTPLTLTALATPTLSCAVAPVVIALSPLTTRTSLPTTLSCTAGNLAATDVVTVSYLTPAGRTSGSLATTTGASWALTLPAGTALPVNALTAFTFTGSRALDSAQAVATATAAVA